MLTEGKEDKVQQATEGHKEQEVIVVPYSRHIDTISQFLNPADVIIVGKTGRNIGQIVKEKNRTKNEHSIVYRLPCKGCLKPYYGETGRSLDVRLKEHKKDLQFQRPKTIVKHSH